MDNKNIISKIKKLMAIANDPSASDQEIQLSAYKAKKLMIEHKIKEFDLYGENKDKNVIRIDLENQGWGYSIWTLNRLAENFRCKAGYVGRINSKCIFVLYGLKDDVEICKPIAEALLYYLNNNIEDLKRCYIGYEDFRIFKRDYFSGFAAGLENALKQAFLEMKVDMKYELAVVGVPAVVEEIYAKKVNKKSSNFTSFSNDGYTLGKKHGSNYDVKQKNLLKG